MANAIGKIITNITEYIEVKTEQVKLKVVARLAKLLSGALSLSFLAMVGLFFAFFLSFAIAFSINEALDSASVGFYIIAGFYFLIIIVTFILVKKGKVQNWLEKLILKISEQEDEQND